LKSTLHQAICPHNIKSRAFPPKTADFCAVLLQYLPQGLQRRNLNQPECGMPEIKIVTEVAGRVCALPIEVGGSVSEGDEIVFVEAMKMEIPVSAPAAGVLKTVLVQLDDVVGEGQLVAIVDVG
jgi:biotin carboxyl carrier protein